MITYPIFLLTYGDEFEYVCNVEELQGVLEPWQVKDCVGFDSKGFLLEFRVVTTKDFVKAVPPAKNTMFKKIYYFFWLGLASEKIMVFLHQPVQDKKEELYKIIKEKLKEKNIDCTGDLSDLITRYQNSFFQSNKCS